MAGVVTVTVLPGDNKFRFHDEFQGEYIWALGVHFSEIYIALVFPYLHHRFK
jgi:hypothetical protein